MALTGSPALAQENGSPLTDRTPLLRTGIFFGRTGISLGPGAYVEVNPLPWLGICATVSHSQATHDVEGGTVRVSDTSMGGCITGHLPEVKKFLISPFIQTVHERHHDRFTLPLDEGTFYYYGDDQTHHVLTVGAMVDRAIVRNGPRWVVRIGKNFGQGPAVENAGGLYLVGGIAFPLDHPSRLGQSFKTMLGMKPTAAPPSQLPAVTASAQ
jgi:hypothetical protein